MVERAHQITSRLAIVGVVIAIVLATLTPGADVETESGLCIFCGELGGVDAILNVLLFVPLGAAMHVFGLRWRAAIGIALATTISIELLQLRVVTGRDASLGDIVMNTIGAAAGFLLSANRHRLVRPSTHTARGLAAASGLAWLGVQLIAAFLLVPVLPRSEHRAAIGRGLSPQLTPFPGAVLSVSVDGVQIREQDLPRDRPYHVLTLHEPASIQMSAVAVACPTTRAAIVHVADDHFEQIRLVAMLRADLIFGVRTGAEVLRLRPIRYLLPSAFATGGACGTAADTVEIQTRYARSGVSMSATRRDAGAREKRFEPRLSQAWAAVLPFLWYFDGRFLERVFGALWIMMLLLPVAYWAGIACGRERRTTVIVATSLLSMLAIGFLAVPLAFGLPAAAPWEWGTALAAMGAGASIALRQRRG